MAELVTNANAAYLRRVGMAPPNGALTRKVPLQPRSVNSRKLHHPMPHTSMWRGNHLKYRYTKTSPGRWGEGESKHKYHQYFSHAKDPTDYGKAGREFELLQVSRGKLNQKPLPQVQYVSAGSKPTWLFKTWYDAVETTEPWQRELQYEEHVPTHLGAKRPLSVLAPSTFHKYMHLAHIDKITVTVSPFVFGHGATLQKQAMDFYRRCLSSRSTFPNEKVFLVYSVDHVSPTVEVTWTDGSTYHPPLLEGGHAQQVIQNIMEQSWLQADKMEAAGTKLPPLAIDDYMWHHVVAFKKKKAVDPKAGKKK